MSRYLITGGAGFIGSHLSDVLIEQNHEVIVFDNLSSGRITNIPSEVQLFQADIQKDYSLLCELMATVDGCFHLAAIASVPSCNQDWLNAHQVNLTNTLKVIDAARGSSQKNPTPVVFASSAAVYGQNQDLPLKESSATTPISMYGVNKLCCEYYMQVANDLFNVPCTGLRLFNVYGPRQPLNSSYSGVVTQFVNRLMHNEPLIIYGDGEQTRDFIFVKDVARFFVTAMQKTSHSKRLFNVCSGEKTSVRQVADVLCHLFNKKSSLVFKPGKAGDINHSLGSPDLAKQQLGLSSQISLEQGLEILIKATNNLP